MRYVLADSVQNTQSAIVDDLVLHRGGDAVALTDEQASRLHAAGVNLTKQDNAPAKGKE